LQKGFKRRCRFKGKKKSFERRGAQLKMVARLLIREGKNLIKGRGSSFLLSSKKYTAYDQG